MKVYVNPNHTVSFDVDAQKTFSPICPNELPVPEGDQIVPELNKNASKAHWRVGSKDCHSSHAVWVATKEKPQFSPVKLPNVDIAWNLHAENGTKGYELLEGLPASEDYDFMAEKGTENHLHPYGACYKTLVPSEKTGRMQSTGVIEFLKSWGITTVILGGLAWEYCVFNTALQLKEAGFEVIFNRSATRAITKEGAEKADKVMIEAGIMIVDSADEIVSLPWG